MVRVSDLTFSYGDKPVFDSAGFTVGTNQKVGLVGANGAGKSTLFRLITGVENGRSGNIEILGKVGLVPQEVKYDPVMEASDTIYDYIGREHPDHEIRKLMSKFDLSDISLDTSPAILSGGQKTKIALIRALLSQPDILLLDEPTNFMDTAGKHWVMNFLKSYPKTLLLISHDLPLMDAAIDKVLYINPHTKKIDEYKGNYSKFEKLKKERDELEKRKVAVAAAHIRQMEEGLSRLRRNKSKKGVRQRVIMERRIAREKEALPTLPKEIQKIKIDLPTPSSVGELPLKAENISKSYGDTVVFNDLNFTILRNQKVALIGKNGAGKSTLIKILTGSLAPDSGTVIRHPDLSIGYYSQEFETYDFNATLLDTLCEKSHFPEHRARAFLGKFNFLGNKVFQSVRSLSGGEKTRFAIALIASQSFNLLILDEPTTYLDVMSQRIILETLKEYKGTMILVSHSEEFVKEIKPDKAFLMETGKMTFWDDELLEKVSEM